MVAQEPYWDRIRRIKDERGLTYDDLVRRSPLSSSTVYALVQPYEDQRAGKTSRSRYPSAEVLEAIAAALGCEPDDFIEYRLAKARELLDERAVGLEQALANLEQAPALAGATDAAGASGPDGADGLQIPGVPQELQDALTPEHAGQQRGSDTRRKRRSGGQAS